LPVFANCVHVRCPFQGHFRHQRYSSQAPGKSCDLSPEPRLTLMSLALKLAFNTRETFPETKSL